MSVRTAPSTRPAARPARPPSSGAARVLAALLALVAAFLLMGVIDLLTLPGWVDQSFVWEVPLEASWGALFTFVLAGAYGWVVLLPRVPWPALVQLGLAALALLVSALGGADVRPAAVAAGVLVSAAVLWLLLGRPPAPSAHELAVRWPLLALAAAGLPLWVPYALEALRRSRSGELGSVTQGIEHWPVQGATGLVLLLGAVVVALWEPGRPLLRVSVSLSAVFVGMAELAYPDRAGAVGSLPWGVGVTLWGLLVALTAVAPAPTPAPAVRR